MALQMLYQQEVGRTPVEEVLARFDPRVAFLAADEDLKEGEEPVTGWEISESIDHGTVDYAKRLVRGVMEHGERIDELVQSQAEHWRLERMVAVDRGVLRLAVYEFLYETDVPKLVVVDEAIELAKVFGSEQSGAFVNGLLDGLLKNHTFPGSMT